LRLRVVGSRTRFLVTASILVLLWLVFVWLAATGRLAELRYLNVPLLHPYPPAGHVQNPFNPGNKGDLIDVSEAARVKGDLLSDGQVELRALEAGDPSLVANADTGRAAEGLTRLISQNNAQGIFERQRTKLDSIVVGRLRDPNDPSITWAVQERGTATIAYYSKSSSTLLKTESTRATATFWLVKVGERYLIADAQITSEPGS